MQRCCFAFINATQSFGDLRFRTPEQKGRNGTTGGARNGNAKEEGCAPSRYIMKSHWLKSGQNRTRQCEKLFEIAECRGRQLSKDAHRVLNFNKSLAKTVVLTETDIQEEQARDTFAPTMFITTDRCRTYP